MLKDADPAYFAGIYIVCGYTDLRYGIDSLAAIIERRYHMNLFVPNTLFLFCGRSASKIKSLLWEGDGFLLLYKRVESGHFTWPRSSDDLKSMSAEQSHWLMQGFAIEPVIHDVTQQSSSYTLFCFVQYRELFSCFQDSSLWAMHSFRRPSNYVYKVSKALHSTSFFYFHLSFFSLGIQSLSFSSMVIFTCSCFC